MFYLLLACFFLTLFWILFGTYHVMISGEITKNRWAGKMQLMGWNNFFGMKLQIQSSSPRHVIVYFFKISFPIRFRSKSAAAKKKADEKSMKYKFKKSMQDIENLKQIQPLIQEILNQIHLHCLQIRGHTSMWDPATSGIIFGLTQWLRSFRIAPLDIHLSPRFYPGDSYAQCHMEMNFRLLSILYLVFHERYAWKPLVSKAQL